VSPLTTHDPDAPVTVHVLEVSPTAVTVNDCGVGPEAAATVTVTLKLPAATVGAGGTLGIWYSEYSALKLGDPPRPTKIALVLELNLIALTVWLFTPVLVKVLSSVPSTLKRLIYPNVLLPPTKIFPSPCIAIASAPVPSAAMFALLENVVSSTPAEEKRLRRPVKSPTTYTRPLLSTATPLGAAERLDATAVLKVVSGEAVAVPFAANRFK
jgi:hypothetical protein